MMLREFMRVGASREETHGLYACISLAEWLQSRGFACVDFTADEKEGLEFEAGLLYLGGLECAEITIRPRTKIGSCFMVITNTPALWDVRISPSSFASWHSDNSVWLDDMDRRHKNPTETHNGLSFKKVQELVEKTYLKE